MADRYVLCRKDLAELGQAPRFCAKPINSATKPNAFGWCDGCRAALPYWPTTDEPTPALAGNLTH